MNSLERAFDLSGNPQLWLHFESQAAQKPDWLQLRPSMQKIVVGAMAQIQPLSSRQLVERQATHVELAQSGLPIGRYAAYGLRKRDEVAQRLAQGASHEKRGLSLLLTEAEVRVARGVLANPLNIQAAIDDTSHPELLQALRVVNEIHQENPIPSYAVNTWANPTLRPNV